MIEIKNSGNIEKEIIDRNTTLVQEFSGDLRDQNIYCNDKNATICFIGCYEENSCSKATVRVTGDSSANIISIICDNRQSCDDAVIIIDSMTDIKLSMECNARYACENVYVNLLSSTDDVIEANISCNETNSCDNLIIDTDDSNNIFINLDIYQYSSSIQINHYYDKNVNVKCGSSDDRRFIRYNVRENIPGQLQVLQLARNEYSSLKLPCEDIVIQCEFTSFIHPRSCSYTYSLEDEFDLVSILNDEYRPNCYWLEIGQLYRAYCIGTCGDSVEYYLYNKTLNLEMIFEEDENGTVHTDSNYTTRSYKTCNEYFGTINDTRDSLNTIDDLFYWVLNNAVDLSDIIHGILKYPMTMIAANTTLLIVIRNQKKILFDLPHHLS